MKKINKSKDAFVLLIALAFVSLLALGSTFLLTVSSQKAYTELRRTQTEMARIIAESGVHISIAAILRGEKSVVSDFDPIEIGDDGTATIEIEESGDASFSSTDSSEKYYDLTSTATYGKQKATVQVLLRLTGDDGDSDGDEYFDGSVFCGGNLTMDGDASVDVAVHANGIITLKGSASFANANLVSSSTKIDMSGGNARIYGSALAPTISLPDWAKWQAPNYFITGGVVEAPVEPKMIELDLEPYLLSAQKNNEEGRSYGESWGGEGYVITDSYISESEIKDGKNVSFNNGGIVVEPKGGVLWVEGNVSFSSSVIVKGCVVATGNVFFGGNATHQQVSEGMPSFISIDGDSKENGNGNGNGNGGSSQNGVLIDNNVIAHGLVYSKNANITIKQGTVYGAVVCPRGNFTSDGSTKVFASGSLPTGPDGEEIFPSAKAGFQVVRWIK